MNKLARSGSSVRTFGLVVAALALLGGLDLALHIAAVRLAHHVTALAEVAGIVIGGGLVVAIVGNRLRRRIRRHTVLELELAKLPPETADANPLAGLTGSTPLTLRETIEALERAAGDRRVDGLLLHANFSDGGMAQLQELRDGLAAFRAAGKFAIAYSDNYTNASYYLATACDRVLLQHGGGLDFAGLGRDVNFIKGALDKLGVEVQSEGRWEYKNAANQVIETHFTGPHREALARLMDVTFDQLVAGVAEGRPLTAEEVRAAADRGPFVDGEALAGALVDALVYRDEAVEEAQETARTGRGRLLLFTDYKKRAGRTRGKGRPVTLGLITATGGIVSRKGGVNPLAGPSTIEADKVSAAIRKATADKRVKAIVLRVDSPGGSAIASETIWRETVRARAAGKPVVVSMGNVAASGGYYISAHADRIVAQPGTVTGSIGVIGGKPLIGAAKQRMGINVEELHTSAHAGMYSVNREFSAGEWERFRTSLDAVYDDFTRRVAEGRKLPLETVQAVARGRVWIGTDAKERGLVDELGGLNTATRVAKEAAGLDAAAPVRIKTFPKKASILERVKGGQPHPSGETARTIAALVALAAPAVDAARQLGLFGDGGTLHCGLQERDWMVR